MILVSTFYAALPLNNVLVSFQMFLGDILRWEQQVRLRHMLTRQYLCIDSKLDVSLVPDPSDPRTVFRLHSVLKVYTKAFSYCTNKLALIIWH